jgi:NADPH:quinone reductase-like Zn-dependent oxidoreductase
LRDATPLRRNSEAESKEAERIAAMIDAGEIATCVGAVLPLDQLRTAHEMMEGMRTRPCGKVVLKTGA